MHDPSRSSVIRFANAMRWLTLALALLWAGFVVVGKATAQTSSLDELISGVVRVKTFINPEARTLQNLGREREGSGIVIDSNGLVLTIGYLIVEADGVEITSNDGRSVPAEVIGYDHETGFGLVRTLVPLKARPMELGKSADVKEKDKALVASFGGPDSVLPVDVVIKREYVGSWEYMVSDALFTAPPHPQWSGAALISHDGKLIGVGSLIMGDISGKGDRIAGNMFVPIDALPPILGDLLSLGRVSGPGRPWLGVTTEEMRGRLVVSRVITGSPAEKAGVHRGDVIVGVGAASDAPRNLADFYRKIWAAGDAGVTVELDVLQDQEKRHIEVQSINRLDHLKLKSTY